MASKLLVAALAVFVAIPCAAEEEELPTMVVMNFDAGKGVDVDTAKLLNDLMLSEFQRAGGYKVFGQQDIVAMMDLEQAKVQTKGCADNACLAEIGGALGANFLVSANVGKVGPNFLLNMKMIDVSKADAAGRSSQIFQDEADMLKAVKAAVLETLNKAAGEIETLVATPDNAVIDPEADRLAAEEQPRIRSVYWDVGAWSAVGATALLVVGGGIFADQASRAHEDLDRTPETEAGRVKTLKDATDKHALTADLMFGFAGATAATALVLFLLMPRGEEPSEVGVTPTRGGAAVPLGGRWGW